MVTRASGQQSGQQTPHFDGLIGEALALLKDGPLNTPQLLRFWNEVNWNKFEDQRVASDAEVARDGSNRVNLYPSLLQKPRESGCFILLREFGHLLYAKAAAPIQRRWLHKLCLPSQAQIDSVQRKLSPEFKSYHELVESFKTACDRYVALNIANALIAKGVPYAQSQNVDIKKWGATQEYCNRRRYHVLIPLVSAYAAKEIYDDFGTALADWLCGTNGIMESSVAEATHGIVKDVIDTIR